jgi:dyslexia susceptibility 1 candidate gene 1 protein
MTSQSKVIIKPGQSKYQWTQTDESIIVYIPLKGV